MPLPLVDDHKELENVASIESSHAQNPAAPFQIFQESIDKHHMCYGPLKVSSGIALRKLIEQKDIFTIWENFVPALFFQTAISRERNEIL